MTDLRYGQTPTDHAAEANRLIWMSWEDGRGDDNVTLIIARAQVHATLAVAAQTPAEPLTVVYRAYFETMPLGLYTTREAARAHCLANATDHGDNVTKADWWPQDEDDPDGSEECLVLQGPSCGDLLTDYSVMPLTVATAYDPEAEG